MTRPTSTALAALSLLSVTALTACGGSSDPATDEPKAGSSTSASTAKAPTPAEHLAATIVTKADTDGFEVEEPDDEYAFAKSTRARTTPSRRRRSPRPVTSRSASRPR
ncbi:hypothetical protein ACWGJV_03265 [Streptomyces tendae]